MSRSDEGLSIHVLLVEDSAAERELLAARLEGAGCRVDAADHAAIAIKRLLELRPDVILMDLGLPGIDGWEAIRMIRQRSRASEDHYSPWVIAHSGFEDARARSRAFTAGCNEYVTKTQNVLGAVRAFAFRTKRAM